MVTATKSSDNSPETARKHLEQSFSIGNYLAVSQILAPVVAVCLIIFCNQLPPLIFRITWIVSRNSMDYSVYRSVFYPSLSVLYYPWYN